MLSPVIIKGGVATDDRGSLKFVNEFDFSKVKRFYQVENHQIGFIRAWHGHKIEAKYLFVSKGAFLIGAVNMETSEIHKFILTSNSPSILYIPSGYANGTKNLCSDSILTIFSTTTLQESIGDDYRFPYDKWNIWDIEYR